MAEERSRKAEERSWRALGAAHDLNNLFQVILGSLELIRRSRGDVPADTVESALRATRQAAELAQRLLGSLRRPPEPPRAHAGEEKVDLEKPYDLARLSVTVRSVIDVRSEMR